MREDIQYLPSWVQVTSLNNAKRNKAGSQGTGGQGALRAVCLTRLIVIMAPLRTELSCEFTDGQGSLLHRQHAQGSIKLINAACHQKDLWCTGICLSLTVLQKLRKATGIPAFLPSFGDFPNSLLEEYQRWMVPYPCHKFIISSYDLNSKPNNMILSSSSH